MKNYRVELICSDIMYVDAEDAEEAERFARDKFGNDYLINEVHVTEKTEYPKHTPTGCLVLQSQLDYARWGVD